MIMPNIETVVEQELCTQCGACEAACPYGNIHMKRDSHWRYFPSVRDSSLCTGKCHGLCREICAGIHEDTSQWPMETFHYNTYGQWCTGPIQNVWLGYATNHETRVLGSSGGVVTALLVHLLETRAIDGALVVGPYDPETQEHRSFIARSRKEIEQAWGSKYYPMPLGRHFKEILNQPGRCAVVLLGCHMRSLRLLEQRFPILKKSIPLRIGLICGYCSGFKAVVDQAREWGIQDIAAITELDYRKGAWPGNFRLKGGDIEKEQVIYDFLMRLPFTTNRRCMICSDLMNETSDITVGDAWLGELTGKRDAGWSVVASRNPEAEAILRRARGAGALYLEKTDRHTFVRSQEKPMRYKKLAFQVRLEYVRKGLKKSVPFHAQDKIKADMDLNPWNRRGNLFFLRTLDFFFKRDRWRQRLYRWIPRSFIHWYVRSIFLMIAHDGKQNFLLKWLFRKEPVLNSDA